MYETNRWPATGGRLIPLLGEPVPAEGREVRGGLDEGKMRIVEYGNNNI
ncbi:MAG: hypothetical protein MUO72_07660 [Bacteroidales bacterium]|nr:hypothetical protein [Bacteroidales bacterium]